MLLTLQPDPDVPFELSEWAQQTKKNKDTFELCSQRLENNLRQDLRSDPNEKIPLLNKMIKN